jgi:thiamine pyrophosphokinase
VTETVLVAGAPLPEAAALHLRAAAAQARLLVGIDGGARTLAQLGFVPHVVTGDFDTLTPAEIDAFAADGARIVPTPDQDYTDFDKAVTYVREVLGIDAMTVFGATGGRADHAYSVLSALIKHGPHARIELIDHEARTFFVPGVVTLTGDDLPGRTLSLLAFGTVEGITTTGVKWPLSGESLTPGVRDGTLNEIVDTTVTITVERGPLVALLFHRPHP